MHTFTLQQIQQFNQEQKDAIEKYALIFGFFHMSLASLEELEAAQQHIAEVFKDE